MRRYTITELSDAATYAQDRGLAALATKAADERCKTALAGDMSRDAFRAAFLAGRFPEIMLGIMEKAIAADAGRDAEIFKAATVMSAATLPHGWSWTIEGQDVVLVGPYVEDMPARLRRLGGAWDAAANAWRVPAAKAASIKRVFANSAKAAAPAPTPAPKPAGLPEDLEKVVARAEACARTGIAPVDYHRSDLERAGYTAYPEAVRRVEAARAAEQQRIEAERAAARAKAEAKRAQEAQWAADRAKRQAEQAAKPAPRRVLLPLSAAPAMHTTVRSRSGEARIYESVGQAFRISEDHPSTHGSHLLGHEGERGAYYYFRAATTEEAAALEQAETQVRAAREAEQARAEEVRAIREEIRAAGETPEAQQPAPQGEIVPMRDTQSRIYGGGEWAIIEPVGAEPRSIWWAVGNGRDGDAWAQNTIPGAIAWRVPWTADLEARIRAAQEVTR